MAIFTHDARLRGAILGVVASVFCLVTSVEAMASTGCDNVGGLSGTTGSSGPWNTVSGFDVGDQVILNVTGSSGTTLYVLGVNGGVSLLRQIFLTGSPQTAIFNITGANNDRSLNTNYGGGGSVTVVASCGGVRCRLASTNPGRDQRIFSCRASTASF